MWMLHPRRKVGGVVECHLRHCVPFAVLLALFVAMVGQNFLENGDGGVVGVFWSLSSGPTSGI